MVRMVEEFAVDVESLSEMWEGGAISSLGVDNAQGHEEKGQSE